MDRWNWLIDCIYHTVWKRIESGKDRMLAEEFRLLYGESQDMIQTRIESYRKKQIQYTLVFFLLTLLLLLIMGIGNLLQSSDILIERNYYGEGERQEIVVLENGDTLQFMVAEREYTEEELDEVFQKGFLWVREQMLLDNESGAQVRSNLNFMTEIPGGLEAEWQSENQDVLKNDGTVWNQDMEEEEEILVKVQLVLSYREEKQSQDLTFCIKAPQYSNGEKQIRDIQEEIKKREEDTREKDSFLLPKEISGMGLKSSKDDSVFGVFLLIGALYFFLLFYDKNRLKDQEKVRKEQLKADYPILIHKLVLYLGAGINLRNTFAQITGEYQEKLYRGQTGNRYVYDELNIMMNEMQAGTGEINAYESFSRRLQDNDYSKLISLLVQNLQKGTDGLLKALEAEEANAFFMRVDMAKKSGEEAGTKLLFPMIMMLVVVMVIIMSPAIMQFGVF